MKKPKFYLSFSAHHPFTWKPRFEYSKLRWKDKFATPRCEREPYFLFSWLWFSIYGTWGDDHYWEQWLWVNEYHGGDVEKAKATWGWVSYDTGLSTWKEY